MVTKKGSRAKQQAESNDVAAFPALGYSCWWTITSIVQSQAELEAAMDTTIGRDYMPDTPGMQRALRTALEASEKRGVITRIPSADGDQIAYTFHTKIVDKINVDLDLEKQQTIVYHKSSKTLEVKTDHNRQEIMDLIAKFSTVFTEEDIRNCVLRFVKATGFTTMRDTGGIYFTPEVTLRNKLRDFIRAAGGKFYSLGVYDVDTDAATMHELVKDGIETDLTMATEDLKKFLADRENGDKLRIGTLETKLDRFKEIRAKAELYRGLLANDMEDLNKSIETLSAEVRAHLSGEIASYPQAKEFPLRERVMYSGKAVEKYGNSGVVVGYFTDNEKYHFAQYVRVQFDQTNKVVAVGKKTLKLESVAKKEAEEAAKNPPASTPASEAPAVDTPAVA